MHPRQREITDTLVELLIATVPRIGARAERRVTNEMVNAFKKVTGKENILVSIAAAALAAPDDAVREVVFPAVIGGEQTLREVVHEFKTKGTVYRRTAQTTLRASYTGHCRRGLIALLTLTLSQPASMIITWEVSFPARHSTAPARKTSSTPATASASLSGSASAFQKLGAVGRSQRTLPAATGIPRPGPRL